MAKADASHDEHLTERQKTWFATLRANLERETGKAFEDWVAIARTCPETAPRARLTWIKTHHGLGQNRASIVFEQAFPAGAGRDAPDDPRQALWKDPASLAILEAVEARLAGLDGLVAGQRKGFSAWSRNFQFAALRPLKGGKARLGLAVTPDAAPGLEAARNEGWSDRLKASLTIGAANEMDSAVELLLKQAWEAS